jgi:hypothetical protein
VIVVVGRPGLDAKDDLDRPAGLIAIAAAAAGARVELVGSIGDDPAGDRVALALGRAGVGHAALLRDPAAVTPRAAGPIGPTPRLDGQDVELGLAYLAEYGVLVVAELLEPAALDAVRTAAEFQQAALVGIIGPGERVPAQYPAAATLLEMPADDEGAFSALVGRYAAGLDRGLAAVDAWQKALEAGGWEPSVSGEAEAEAGAVEVARD